MKKIYLLAAFWGVLSCFAFTQGTVLYSENFETGGGSFSLNTTDVQSTSNGYNDWVINNAYSGGAGTDPNCLGATFTISNTSQQPLGITNQPTSSYLHILSDAAVNSNVFCASFLASDGLLLCYGDEYNFAKMNQDINTTGYAQVDLTFWWLCVGSAASYGEVYYSTNGGTNWNIVTTPRAQYNQVGNWTQATVSIPQFGNQTTLRFGFRFVNQFTFSASDPPFSIDEVVITGINPQSITTDNVSRLSVCAGDTLTTSYTATGTYNPGNTFTAELSDGAGSFAAPVQVGSVAATTSGSIACTIPPATPAGTGYRIRVVSSNPVVTGSDNGVDITVNPGPVAGMATVVPDTVCEGDSAQVSISGHSGAVQWYNSFDGQNFNLIPGATGTTFNTGQIGSNVYYYAEVGNTCGTVQTNTVRVTLVPNAIAGMATAVPDTICEGDSSLITLSNFNGNIQWQVLQNFVWTDIPGANTSSYATGPLTQNSDNVFRARVSSAPCGEQFSNVVEIEIVPYPIADFTWTDVGLDYTFVDQSTGATSWWWDFDDGDTSSQRNPTHSYAGMGTYNVSLIITNAGGCSDTVVKVVSPKLSAGQGQGIPGLRVFPNPFSAEVHIEWPIHTGLEARVEVFDLLGKRVALLSGEENNTMEYQAVWRPEKGVASQLFLLKVTEGDRVDWRRVMWRRE